MIVEDANKDEAAVPRQKKSPKARMSKLQMQIVNSYIQQHYNEVKDEWTPRDGRTEMQLWEEMASELSKAGTSVTRALTLDEWEKHVGNHIKRESCEPGDLYKNTKPCEMISLTKIPEKAAKRRRLCHQESSVTGAPGGGDG
ncbi:hypothetical protein QAD02_003057 [Eretmocerus hayati]|uniref:Uncharacterized protein n=1 Tax=Eretmocerus hayati TaxID=131215 RepID=A0ACC2NKR8_9HYME|nr:hypothetical protein QAD02_003057 [Eretmocerus hayati]